MTTILSGDIGGTKTILRLTQVNPPQVKVLAEETYASGDFPHLTPLIRQFLDQIPGHDPDRACLAIAGPVFNQTSQVTNLGWHLRADDMAADLNIPDLTLINDFVAIGYGILTLNRADLYVLQDRPSHDHAPIAILGAGTGLGEALLVWQGDRYQVLPLEGGHTDYPPRNPLEIGLLEYLLKKLGRVSVERVVSGQGICNIYAYLRDTGKFPESAKLAQQMSRELDAAIISDAAMAGQDPLCEKTLDMFIAAYGAEAGNLALKTLPLGGVYIAGGIAAKILAKLQDGKFLDSFVDKGRLRPLLEQLPVSIVLNPKVGLQGAHLVAASKPITAP
ncbi:glucokinase [Candidatus Synechococcus calcipolaris G9]|uniref:Glucokinase n=1 Tax=Candidatus Synechococcus calcipolaris G9 TaxID=1497997 RepID=A0ABT6EZC7_9SYNE|nr:glucokinase [Candidatus Synechococcus calcipolaris]MDG2990964.1 glucokinase [Candidatus Synechococcus calcipolaris G9]